ncbi:MAG: phytanoyl-CoA dioxygenase family protein [Candidatus Eremiobacteraeota bacterium]|nr:phytanoyl-CoA dioxygenase family protein [Candidatus Eremiobacteraeota bacterium]
MQARFEEDGYTIVPVLIDAALVESTKKRIDARLARVRSSPEFIAGAKGTINLPNLETDVREIVERLDDPAVARLLETHLGPSYSRRISYRSPRPGHGAQTLHADWPEPVPIGQWAVANVFIALCDVDASNGGTRLVPGSHREFDRFQAKSPSQRHPNEIVPRLKSGDALVFSGHILHSGTRNTSSRERPLVIVNYQRK